MRSISPIHGVASPSVRRDSAPRADDAGAFAELVEPYRRDVHYM